MLRITLRDLQFRRRQFAIAVLGAALVFALALALTGISAGFRTEAQRTVDRERGETWLVSAGSTGPFTSRAPVPSRAAAAAARLPDAGDAHAFTAFGDLARLPGGEELSVAVVAGRTPVPRGRAIVSDRIAAEPGERIRVAGVPLEVERRASGATALGGAPAVLVNLADAQRIAYGGSPRATAIVVDGAVRAPAGLRAMTGGEVREDMLKPLAGATSTIDLLRVIMAIVAAIIIGAVTYLSALERLRDFAVLKAIGGSSRTLALSLALQAVIAAVLAAVLGVVLALLLRGAFPIPVDLQPAALIAMPIVAALVGVIASLAALRRVLRVDPALAFGG